jgi:SAM-dependent methyltransferase
VIGEVKTRMKNNTPYTGEFYKLHRDISRQSAQHIVPMVLELVHPKSVIDVGCGVGAWLSVFKEYGVDDIYGIDGDYVDRNMLEIPEQRFFPSDLSKAIRLNRQFDLVVSLEVAEHLPNDCAETFVDSLTKLGSVILFSAAIPHQGGMHHVNEQWPEYWAKHFQAKEYAVIDCIRKKVWTNNEVDYYYAQNILLFTKMDYLEKNPLLKSQFQSTNPASLSIVHPTKYLEVIGWIERLYLLSQDIAALIPPGDAFILIDQGAFGNLFSPSYRAIPFLERGGKYWKMPPDDITAIEELEQMRRSRATSVVFTWPAFWWFDYYRGFNEHLRSNYNCTLDNERLVAFDLRRDSSCSR